MVQINWVFVLMTFGKDHKGDQGGGPQMAKIEHGVKSAFEVKSTHPMNQIGIMGSLHGCPRNLSQSVIAGYFHYIVWDECEHEPCRPLSQDNVRTSGSRKSQGDADTDNEEEWWQKRRSSAVSQSTAPTSLDVLVNFH